MNYRKKKQADKRILTCWPLSNLSNSSMVPLNQGRSFRSVITATLDFQHTVYAGNYLYTNSICGSHSWCRFCMTKSFTNSPLASFQPTLNLLPLRIFELKAHGFYLDCKKTSFTNTRKSIHVLRSPMVRVLCCDVVVVLCLALLFTNKTRKTREKVNIMIHWFYENPA